MGAEGQALEARPRSRAEKFVDECHTRLDVHSRRLAADEAIKVTVSFGLESVSIGNLGGIGDDIIVAKGTNRQGNLQVLIGSVEQCVFAMTVVKIPKQTSKASKREIGFHVVD